MTRAVTEASAEAYEMAGTTMNAVHSFFTPPSNPRGMKSEKEIA